MAAKDDFINSLKKNSTLRTALNSALHNLFVDAQILGLSLAEKRECVDALKPYVVFDNNYDNVHIHWSS